MLMMPQGICYVVSMIYPKDSGFDGMAIEGERALATRRIFRTWEEAAHYRSGIAKCFSPRYHKVQGIQVFE